MQEVYVSSYMSFMCHVWENYELINWLNNMDNNLNAEKYTQQNHKKNMIKEFTL